MIMTANEWLENLPENPCLERDQSVLEAIDNGLVNCDWVEVTSESSGHSAVFKVLADAAYVTLEDGSRFRFQVSANLAQKCADALDASFMTAKVSDLAYKQATVVLPVTTLTAGPDMATTTKSKEWNTIVESKRAGATGLLRDCGKLWILDNSLAYSSGAVNYGFYDKNAPYTGPGGLKMWQTIGKKHDHWHSDYSQTLILTRNTCEVDGQVMQTAQVMTDKTLCGLVSYQGPLKYTRQPM